MYFYLWLSVNKLLLQLARVSTVGYTKTFNTKKLPDLTHGGDIVFAQHDLVRESCLNP